MGKPKYAKIMMAANLHYVAVWKNAFSLALA